MLKLDEDVLDAITNAGDVEVETDTTAVVEEKELSLLVVGVSVD